MASRENFIGIIKVPAAESLSFVSELLVVRKENTDVTSETFCRESCELLTKKDVYVNVKLRAEDYTRKLIILVIAIESYFSDYDHHTLGVNATVGAIIGAVFASAAAYPTPAGALIDFRNRINYIAGPTPFLVDFENPAAVISSISAIMPTITPFPQALEIISSVYDYLGSVAYSELNNLTSLPYNISHSLGTFVPPEETPAPTTGPTSLPVTTTKPPVDTTAGPVVVV
ncbi:hypothetical protein M7I_3233 [Glarea lozoyensis 74030]|uniref:Uncharacterized protein n=1 Tax=Glarea lozoyensis (strain ATCC 74030 / MF5533) TaxID=1104152 RepID=H0EKZ9_GLAL7|nr:hypothetical protein M7I_3233 [Glarea lozoyensis 74030]